MSDARLWLAGLVALPALVIGASTLRLDVAQLRRIATAAALAMLLVALGIAVSPSLHNFSIRTSALSAVPGGEAIIRIDTLSAALLPFAAGLWLLTVAVTPRAALDRRGLRRTALATLITLVSFLTESAIVLLLLSMASVWVFLFALADPAHRYQRRVVGAYLGFSTLLFAVGVALLVSPGAQNTTMERAGMWLIVIAALVRKGIVPFHAWVPEVFDHGRLGPAILFNAPQLGAYMTVVLIVPRASPEMLRIIAILALGTAVYGAALALVRVLVQESIRAGDGGARLHQRQRTRGRAAGVGVGRARVCRPRPLRARPRSAPRAARSDDLPRRVRAHASARDRLSLNGPGVHRFPRDARFHRSGAAG
jgi:NADH:ubiquinone oxidoreductase subunit 2 (subunit N)